MAETGSPNCWMISTPLAFRNRDVTWEMCRFVEIKVRDPRAEYLQSVSVYVHLKTELLAIEAL
jgi:hypothetical protein